MQKYNWHAMQDRDYKVVKSNQLIQQTRYSLGVTEQKILLAIIRAIKPNDTELKPYMFSIHQFCDLIGIKYSTNTRRQIRQAIQNLDEKRFWLPTIATDGTEETTLVHWIQNPVINESNKTIAININPKLAPYLLNQDRLFTSYAFSNVAIMTSKYSIRVYELMLSYLNLHRPIPLKIKSVREKMIAVPDEKGRIVDDGKYPRVNDIKRNVIEPAVREINAFSNLNVSYEPVKEGRSVTGFDFRVKLKNKSEQRLAGFVVENTIRARHENPKVKREVIEKMVEKAGDTLIPVDKATKITIAKGESDAALAGGIEQPSLNDPNGVDPFKKWE